jgi:hypothetical protein
MKYKILMLVTLMLLAILTIGAISASDDLIQDNLTVQMDEMMSWKCQFPKTVTSHHP